MSLVMNWLIPKAHAAVASGEGFQWLKISAADTTDLPGLFATVIDWVLMIAAGLAVIYLIYSGILYITAAGNPDSAKKGQQGIINAIIGIVIIVLAYTIITVVMNFAGGAASTEVPAV